MAAKGLGESVWWGVTPSMDLSDVYDRTLTIKDALPVYQCCCTYIACVSACHLFIQRFGLKKQIRTESLLYLIRVCEKHAILNKKI